jgi:hypothetical protein
MVKTKKQVDDMVDTSLKNVPIKRKRGRPKKNQQVQKQTIVKKTKKVEKKNKDDEEIILHLPFALSELNNMGLNTNNLSSDGNSTNIATATAINVFTITDLTDGSSEEYLKGDNHTLELVEKIKDRDVFIKKLENEVTNLKKIISDTMGSGINQKKVVRMDIDIVNVDGDDTLIRSKTDIACWWCTEQFSTLPCFIPEKHEGNKYYVFGCFCSYGCAASYNCDMNDYCVWDRFSLIKKLYRELFGETELVIAAPRQCLKKFGGILSIDEFRNNMIKNRKEYRFIMPPMVSIIPYIEESYRSDSRLEAFKSSKNNLVLKRSKPLPNSRNTLFETMGLVRSKN